MGYILRVTVVPHASERKIMRWNEGIKVCVTSRAQEGKANRELLLFLGKHFKNPRLISGHKSKKKGIFIENEMEEAEIIIKKLVDTL